MFRSGPYRTEMNMDLTGFALCGRAYPAIRAHSL